MLYFMAARRSAPAAGDPSWITFLISTIIASMNFAAEVLQPPALAVLLSLAGLTTRKTGAAAAVAERLAGMGAWHVVLTRSDARERMFKTALPQPEPAMLSSPRPVGDPGVRR